MAESVHFHANVGPHTVQVVHDPEQPYGATWAGRVLGQAGNVVHQTEWTTGNGWAIDKAEAWCRLPPPVTAKDAEAMEAVTDASGNA